MPPQPPSTAKKSPLQALPASPNDMPILKEATAEAAVALLAHSHMMQDAAAVQRFPGSFGQPRFLPPLPSP